MVFPTKTLIIALSIVFKSTILISQATAMTSPSQASAVKPLINHLLQQTKLVSQFYALRHGQSLANVEKIISSDPQVSTVKHGLSELGMEQARLAGRSFASNYCKRDGPTGSVPDLRGVAIFSSDFTRARETASIFAEELAKSKIPLYKDDIILETRLRERYFGDLNGGPDTRYQDVWNIDLKDADHTEFHVESANSVLHRTTKLVLELDEILERQQSAQSKGSDNTEDSRWKCILVAHGDVLQILQTGFLRHPDASRHRSLEHLETATIRELILPE